MIEPLFEPPTAPDGSTPVRERKERVPDPKAVCKSAGIDLGHRARPAPYPGPRCATCHRKELKARKERAKERHVETNYGLTAEEYAELYRAQGGACYICRIATGARKRLAVDHDHVLAAKHDHPVHRGCKACIRGLACGWCNREVLGRLGGNPATYARIADDLRDPPARRLFRSTDEGTR